MKIMTKLLVLAIVLFTILTASQTAYSQEINSCQDYAASEGLFWQTLWELDNMLYDEELNISAGVVRTFLFTSTQVGKDAILNTDFDCIIHARILLVDYLMNANLIFVIEDTRYIDEHDISRIGYEWTIEKICNEFTFLCHEGAPIEPPSQHIQW